MAYAFPDNPNDGDKTPDGKWVYNGTKQVWERVSGTASVTPYLKLLPGVGESQEVVAADPADTPLTLVGAPSQVGNYLTVQKDDGTDILKVTAQGDLLNNGHYFQVTPSVLRCGYYLSDGRGQFAGGIGMCAIPEDDVKQNDGYFGIIGFLAQALDTKSIVDHRVQPARGELILAQVDDTILLANQRVLQNIMPLFKRDV